MLSKDLETTLNKAFKSARERRHEFMTVEHLLLALLENASVIDVLQACQVNISELRQELSTFLEQNTPVLQENDHRETQPTLGFQRVLQRAVFHVQSSGKKEVTGANVLVAIFGEQESHAVYLLNKYDLTRLDVVNYISHGISNVPNDDENAPEAEEKIGDEESSAKRPLESFATNLNELARAGKIARTIPCWSARRASAKRRLPRAWRRASSTAPFPKCSGTPPSMRWTWARWWPAPSTAAISKNA
jgi:ATP-dependent Clp protease ATP-binding subunit ClpA